MAHTHENLGATPGPASTMSTTPRLTPAVSDLIADVIRREGGYVDHPADRGGPTNMGITLKTLSDWYKRPATVEEVQNLTRPEAASIYASRYFFEPGIDRLPQIVRPAMFDAAVHHGPTQAVKLLQDCVSTCGPMTALKDGKIGPQTITATELAVKRNGAWFLLDLVQWRREYLLGIVDRDAGQRVFLRGWMNRLAELVPTAEQLRTA